MLGRAGCGLVVLLVLLSAPAARATHIVGGEMDLQYLSGNTYQLTLNLYFDAVNGQPGALDTNLTAGIFDKATNRSMATLLLPLINNTFVSYTNPTCTVGSLSTKALVYRSTIELPTGTYNSPQGYYVAVERCCRNVSISNIVAPGNAAQTFYLEFPAVLRRGLPFRDSTPRVFPPLADYACLGETFTYDFAGQDPDGDSLVYDMVTPLNGHSTPAEPKPVAAASAPYPEITWQAGRSATNQIPGTPGLGIGARTGRLTVRPSSIGLFVFGVRCQEFRKGEKIGETRRDFQLQVLVCPRNAAPSLVLLPSPTRNTPYRPGRDTLRIAPGTPHCVRLRFTDPDPNSQLTLSLRPVGYAGPLPTFTTATSGTVHTAGQPDTLVASLCFSDCTDTRGKVAYIDVLVADNGCSLPKHDTIHVAFIGTPPPNAPPTLVSTAGPTLPLHVRPGQALAFDLIATDTDGDPILFTLSGSAGFGPGGLGATLTPQAQVGQVRRARFAWPVDCRAVTDPTGQPRQLLFTATSTSACGTTQPSATLSVPVIVDYDNAPPALTSTLPPAAGAEPVLIRLPLGRPYSATLTGRDTDLDVLALSATGQGFDLAAAGMRFVTSPSPAGQASGVFTWLPGCDAASVANGRPQPLTVTFQLQEATCKPVPQTRTVRFEVINPDTATFTPPNLILPTGTNQANRTFTLSSLPPDFCDTRFAGIKIFSRWGRMVYESGDRNFTWSGENTAGTYYYLLTYTTGRRFKGWVEVIQ
ncbi:gliding motility-associated C-terminal domain-containing protein [Hymenobacter sp. H14-R3]|uniref:T9SS type B sorting domain-containing protein n=1 Tax=Hymenobacter sp. H14-R3 TaxID=3046308 RepID=UPI0024B96C9D|nr:gliding motility-associated C-terminal domain-containing protein [Hymenobacter sp. H14-R3]MDJ0366036.1 gliding motility-associated C-terminal domain-containing protein [Hymenobacter sp. H14-R3]